IREVWYVRAKISPFLPSPQNINNLMRVEIKELHKTIHQQSTLIENLNKTIAKLIDLPEK
ncbi:MAG: peptidase S24, partial [Bacteroidota bacterium]